MLGDTVPEASPGGGHFAPVAAPSRTVAAGMGPGGGGPSKGDGPQGGTFPAPQGEAGGRAAAPGWGRAALRC